MKYICLIITLILPLFSCSFSDESDYYEIAYKIANRFVKDMGKKHYLSVGCYGGNFNKLINSILFSFKAIGPLSQEELRVLMVEIIEEFLERINKDEDIRQYLASYPFTASNLEFQISLIDTRGEKIKNKGSATEMLYKLRVFEGKMKYSILNDDKVCWQDIYEESYEEALEIVKKQRPELFLKKAVESNEVNFRISCPVDNLS